MKKPGLIFRKEVMNAVRDRRVLISTVIVPLLVLPLVTMLPMMMIGKKEHEARERPSSIVVTGLKYPELESPAGHEPLHFRRLGQHHPANR